MGFSQKILGRNTAFSSLKEKGKTIARILRKKKTPPYFTKGGALPQFEKEGTRQLFQPAFKKKGGE